MRGEKLVLKQRELLRARRFFSNYSRTHHGETWTPPPKSRPPVLDMRAQLQQAERDLKRCRDEKRRKGVES